ncbi:MAG TPA: DUF4238 domain-containing protein [Terriglobales bacterium]|nr:DUF4238 domain-containing protein [Terriglobales bacterium]
MDLRRKMVRDVKLQHSRHHHYVPQWYQRGFLLPGASRFFYLDLNPDTVVQAGVSHKRNAVLRWGPKSCFYRDDLYTVKLGQWSTDQIERVFFGEVDRRGRDAVRHFAHFDSISDPTWGAGRDLAPYMDAQKFRTPRGLDLIRLRTGSFDHNATLFTMSQQFQFSTMWMESIWEIVGARLSPTKFILSDDPVTFYCKNVFPSEWQYPNEMSLKQVGTRTIFPLTLNACLIITHLEFVRHPRAVPTMHRTNARSFQPALKYLGDIQFGRELEEDEVLRINHIVKKRAVRYVAASHEDWLYPERHVSTSDWTTLDDDWFLLPNLWRIHFTRQITIGHADGRVTTLDEYGRRPWQRGYRDERQRDREWETFEAAKREWAKKRVGKSRARTDERVHGGRDIYNKLIDDYLREEGLLSSATHTSVAQVAPRADSPNGGPI